MTKHRLLHDYKPDPETTARFMEEAKQMRREQEERRLAQRPEKLRLLAALSSPPPNLENAADCPCSCHPHWDSQLHDGGVRCNCQLTKEELGKTRAEMWEQFRAITQKNPTSWNKPYEELERTAVDLGVEATLTGLAAPMVISGMIDGRGFYLRERHGSYRLVISPEAEPTQDPWVAPSSEGQIEIASGDEHDFDDENGNYSCGVALRLAVEEVRKYLRQTACPHSSQHDFFCSNCGIQLTPLR